MSEEVWTSVDPAAHVAWLRWSNPTKGNAISSAMAARLAAAVTALEDDDSVLCIVLAAEGADLTSGFDAAEAFEVYRAMPGGGAKVPSQRSRLRAHDRFWWGPRGLFAAVAYCPKVTLLAAHGRVFGPGFYLATVCDLVIAASDAQFAHPRWDLLGVDGDVSLLAEMIGLKRAKEVAYLGKVIASDEAFAWDLVDAVVAPQDLETTALELAGNCAALLKDGVVTGAYFRNITLQEMGLGVSLATATQLGAFASNIHHRPGELNFLKERRDHGVGEALELARRHIAGEAAPDQAEVRPAD
jgi:enoyl-CoA hydratase/carnithine racemase